MHLIAIALGGAFGALARYWLSGTVAAWLGRDFPYGTLIVNLLGALLIGLLSVLLLERLGSESNWSAFALIGVLGAFTTFSTFSLDTISLLQQAAYFKALVNILTNVLLCLVAVYIGILLAKITV